MHPRVSVSANIAARSMHAAAGSATQPGDVAAGDQPQAVAINAAVEPIDPPMRKWGVECARTRSRRRPSVSAITR